MDFFKYQGTGNDFVFIDNRNNEFPQNDKSLIARLCDRRFGIGADGVVLIQEHETYNFEMVYFNPDSSQSFCGNASRCAVHFADYLGIVADECSFLAIDGPHNALIRDGLIHLKMSDVQAVERLNNHFFINTGSPHLIYFSNNLDDVDVYLEGRLIRYGEPYRKTGVNVNFVQLLPDNQIYARTYERGVENETLSCGTGVTAAALSVSFKNYHSPVRVKTKGGPLQVAFEKHSDSHFDNIYLIGPAVQVFSGKIEV